MNAVATAQSGDTRDKDEIVAAIYARAFESPRWSALLEILRDDFGLSKAAIIIARTYVASLSPDLPLQRSPYVGDEAERSMENLADEAVAIRDTRLAHGDAQSDHLLGLNIRIADTPVWIRLYRGHAHPFDAADATRLRLLAVHIRNAATIAGRVEQLENKLSFHNMALNRVSVGLVIVAGHDPITWTNETADRILSNGDGLTVTNGKLCCTRPADTTKLWSLIKAARADWNTTFAANFSRPCAERDWSVMVIANPEHGRAGEGGIPDIGVFIRDTGHRATLDPKVLKELFEFTHTEVRLAISLTAGASVEEAASELGIKLATVRVHLRSMFGKVGVHRQSELMRRILV